MHSWEIVCIEIDEDSEFNDCKAVSELGYHAPVFKTKSSDVVAAQIHQGHRSFHIELDGVRHPVTVGRHPDVNFYARTLDEDDPSDPLLTLDSIAKYRMDNKLGDI